MEEEILEILYKENEKQSKRLIKYFSDIYGKKYCSGEQYHKIITYLNIFYCKIHTDDELKLILTDGNGDGGLSDAFVFTNKSFDIFDIKESPNLRLREIQQLKSRIKDLIFPDKRNNFDYNSLDIIRIKDHLKKVHLGSRKIMKCNIYVVREKFNELNQDIKNEIKEIEKNPRTKIIFLDKSKFIKILLKQKIYKNWRIRTLDYEKVAGDLKRRKLKYLILGIRISTLLRLYSDNLITNVNLFDKNVRKPKKFKILSEGIIATIENNTKNFFLFHNGITITSSSIKLHAGGVNIYEPQVVNGGHTLKNLYDNYKNKLDNSKIKEALVLCKIIEADSDTIDLICEASNTQKQVKTENLRTNDIFQKELGLFINTKSYNKFYYKIKEDINLQKNSFSIGYVEFFQWIYAIFYDDPSSVKNAKAKIFKKEDRSIYENLKFYIRKNLNSIVFLCEVSKLVKDQIKKENSKSKKHGLLKIINIYLIVGLFLLKSLNIKDFEKIYRILKKYADNKIKNDRNINYNKIFNQSDSAWIYLKKKLKIINIYDTRK